MSVSSREFLRRLRARWWVSPALRAYADYIERVEDLRDQYLFNQGSVSFQLWVDAVSEEGDYWLALSPREQRLCDRLAEVERG